MSRKHHLKKRIVINTFFNGFTGYGVKIIEIVRGLLSRGHEVKCRVLFLNEAHNFPVPDDIKATFVEREQPEALELVFYPPRHLSDFPNNSNKKQVLYTMWETDQLPQEYVRNCNRYVAIITPTEWNRGVFRKSGVNIPIYVSPLGVDMQVFKPNLRRFPSECVFVTAGRVSHGYARKGIDYAMEVFRKAFPREENAKLRIKCTPDCQTAPNFDSRISVVKAVTDTDFLVNFYQDSTAYLDTTLAEGFGLHQLEANACGKLVLGANFSGKPIFEKTNLNIPVKYSLVRCNVEDPYQKTGKWAKLDEKDLISKMRHIYSHQEDAWMLGQLNRKTIEHLSMENMVTSLEKTLRAVNII